VIAQLSSSPAGTKPLDQQARLKEAARQFEAVFLRQMISSMRSASLGEDLLGSDATNQFRDMSDARTADAMAEKGALGIAQMLLKQFTPMVVPQGISAQVEPVEAGSSALRQAQGERSFGANR
jgi:flagellar protein FlgJ